MKRIAFIYLACLLFMACRKDNAIPPNSRPVNSSNNNFTLADGVHDSLKKYFNFQPGSYWIFIRESDSLVDSVYLIHNTDNLYFSYQTMNGPGMGPSFFSYKNYIKLQWNLSFEIPNLILSGDKLTNNVPGGQYCNHFSSYVENGLSRLTGEQFDSLVLSTGTYYNVSKTKFFRYWTSSGIHPLDSNIYYISLNEGFVRREILNSQGIREYWNLSRCFLIR